MDSTLTVLDTEATAGLGEIKIHHPPGTFAPTPASLISLRAIGTHAHLLHGAGIDWGSGTGCLSIAAARIPAVERVLGLEISSENVRAATANAALNGIAAKAAFLVSDSYEPISQADRTRLSALRGKVSFVLANPPTSDSGDGFEFRRTVLRGARDFLRSQGIVFLSISSQYGEQRILQLERDAPGFVYRSLLASTDWVPFDLARPDLLECLRLYASVEENGGRPYAFKSPDPGHTADLSARAALHVFEATGKSPLSRWQTHLFDYRPQ
jgi:methyltransferase family protein